MAAKKKANGPTSQPSRKVETSASKPDRAIRPSAVAKAKGKFLPQPASEMARQPAVVLPPGYVELLEDIKDRIRHAQIRAAVGASRELIRLYWDIGREIVQRQQREGWGKGIVDRLAGDIQKAFPGIHGFSASNVSRMRAFFLSYAPEDVNSAQAVPKLQGERLAEEKSAQAVPKMPTTEVARLVPQFPSGQPPAPLAEIPWGHNVILLFKLSDPAQRFWYAAKTIEHGWSRAVLTVHQIESDLFGRRGEGDHQLPPHAARPAVRPGPANAQRPLRLRLPDLG